MADIPSGIPQPDGSMRISQKAKADSIAREAHRLTLLEFSDFILRGVVPGRLSDRGKSAD